MGEEKIIIKGVGAVSPAGWTAQDLCRVVLSKETLPVESSQRVEGSPVGYFRRVPANSTVASWMKQPRFRRTTTIAKYALAAVFEAMGEERLQKVQAGELKVGVVFCTMNGCVQFSRRFYSEVLKEPLLASPILFPETVYNAPSSHLSSLLGSMEINYTLVGDANEFVRGIELATQWLAEEGLDGCLVVSAEEGDWLGDEALELFKKKAVTAEGAAAVYLEKSTEASAGEVQLEAISETQVFTNRVDRRTSLERIIAEMRPLLIESPLLFAGTGIKPSLDRLETDAFVGVSAPEDTYAIRELMGDGFSCTGGWQVVCAVEALKNSPQERQALIQSSGLFQQNVALLLANSCAEAAVSEL